MTARKLANSELSCVRGLGHCPVAVAGTSVMLLEPASVANTGDVGGERTSVVQDLM